MYIVHTRAAYMGLHCSGSQQICVDRLQWPRTPYQARHSRSVGLEIVRASVNFTSKESLLLLSECNLISHSFTTDYYWSILRGQRRTKKKWKTLVFWWKLKSTFSSGDMMWSWLMTKWLFFLFFFYSLSLLCVIELIPVRWELQGRIVHPLIRWLWRIWGIAPFH